MIWTAHDALRRIFPTCALLCLATVSACAGPIAYSFSATTRATPASPAHEEAFQLLLPDFLPVTVNGPVVSFASTDPALVACANCAAPPASAVHFLRGGSGDSIQFQDTDGVSRFYLFPANTLTTPGTFDTVPGINVNVGRFVVSNLSDGSAVPEPASWTMLIFGFAPLAAAWWLKRRRNRDAA